MSTAIGNLANAATSLDTGNDSIVIVEYISGKVGGATLDVTGWTPDVIPGGHVIIQETATGNLKPFPVSGSAYDALPANHTISPYVTVASVLTTKPFVGLMDRGTVNPNAQKYTISSVLAAVKTAQPQIIYRAD
ncbi:hypothetical protein [Pedobacter punctiformis]|uniref:Uncharacterized protein n=1 Tax=Pedobacter punctiformis TaxID=3004097 RepID=A0ABT4LAL8_9SPHI|nr:hypothetical protein [Pedobacter sp. HCMS5-2]MCZ4244972.1 hypothetical protein [Pedobacter sp. HCMS5-2]